MPRATASVFSRFNSTPPLSYFTRYALHWHGRPAQQRPRQHRDGQGDRDEEEGVAVGPIGHRGIRLSHAPCFSSSHPFPPLNDLEPRLRARWLLRDPGVVRVPEGLHMAGPAEQREVVAAVLPAVAPWQDVLNLAVTVLDRGVPVLVKPPNGAIHAARPAPPGVSAPNQDPHP